MNHMKDAAIDAHNATMAEYEAMTFKELIRQTIDHSFDGVMPPDDWIEMLRRVAIREASVGTCHIGIGFNLILNEPDTPDGDYLLIPKEREP